MECIPTLGQARNIIILFLNGRGARRASEQESKTTGNELKKLVVLK
ncbi:MAG: hypothetical protein KAH84_05935 [Thiomargarita sp.]|nr:hypothetical protein [Thiomargarita sp.]